MRAILALLLSTLPLLAQVSYVPSLLGTWEPRNLVTKAGLVVSYDPGNTATETFNPVGYAAGSGVSWLSNRVSGVQSDLIQATALNQPKVSRADNKGNLAAQSEDLSSTPWVGVAINAFGVDDSGGAGAGSFANTSRTTDPAGGNTADFIQEDSATNYHCVEQAITYYPGTWRASTYFKAAGRNYAVLIMFATTDCKAIFDLVTLNTTTNFGANWTSPVSTITDVGNGWRYCTLVGTYNANSSGLLELHAHSSFGSGTYAGNNTSGVYIYRSSVSPITWDDTYVATTTAPIHAGLGGRSTLYLDGNYYLKTATFTLAQPYYVCALVKPWRWVADATFFDGDDSTHRAKFSQLTTNPRVKIYAGTSAVADNNNVTLGSWHVAETVFNGASSSITVDAGAATTGNPGSQDANGITLGAKYDATEMGTFEFAGSLICNKVNAATELNYLRWGFLKQAGLY